MPGDFKVVCTKQIPYKTMFVLMRLHSTFAADVGEVLSNGTLQVTNSSSLFLKTSVVTLTCSSRDGGQELTFPVLLEGIYIHCNT